MRSTAAGAVGALCALAVCVYWSIMRSTAAHLLPRRARPGRTDDWPATTAWRAWVNLAAFQASPAPEGKVQPEPPTLRLLHPHATREGEAHRVTPKKYRTPLVTPSFELQRRPPAGLPRRSGGQSLQAAAASSLLTTAPGRTSRPVAEVAVVTRRAPTTLAHDVRPRTHFSLLFAHSFPRLRRTNRPQAAAESKSNQAPGSGTTRPCRTTLSRRGVLLTSVESSYT